MTYLILVFLEEDAGGGSIGVIVNSCGIHVRNLLVEVALAEAVFSDFFQGCLAVSLVPFHRGMEKVELCRKEKVVRKKHFFSQNVNFVELSLRNHNKTQDDLE